MRNILTIFVILTSLFFAPNIDAKEQSMPNGDFSTLKKTSIALVTEIINPLTLKLDNGSFIQLAGLNFPDLDFYDSGDLSITAQKILEDFLVNHKVIIYQTASKDKGRMNRMGHNIAHLVRVDKDIWAQGLLLSLGVARVRTTPYNPEMATQMLDLEKQARENKLGMWNMDEYKILTPEQAEKHIGSYQIVEGRVHNVSIRKNRLYLNFGKNWKDDFTISMSTQNLKKFLKKKINPKHWGGKTIRARGWLRYYNGPYIDIKHPESIETLFEEQENSDPANIKDALPNHLANKDKKIKPRKKDKGSALPYLND